MTRTALAAIGGRGFVLAGSGAIREHGLTNRPTQDVDLFTNVPDVAPFTAAAGEVMSRFRTAGWVVEQVRRATQSAQLHVTSRDGTMVEVDLGVDWRAHEPVAPETSATVLSGRDAVASKVGALYSRMEAQDFLDVDAIRPSGRFTDVELLPAVAERDRGFEVAMFAIQLAHVRGVDLDQVVDYGVDAAGWAGVVDRLGAWADRLAAEAVRPAAPAAGRAPRPGLAGVSTGGAHHPLPPGVGATT